MSLREHEKLCVEITLGTTPRLDGERENVETRLSRCKQFNVLGNIHTHPHSHFTCTQLKYKKKTYTERIM